MIKKSRQPSIEVRTVRVPVAPEEAAATLRRLDRIAKIMDASIRVPGTNFRFGLDPLLGLLPGVGDLAGVALTTYLIAEAKRFGLPKRAYVKMGWNALVDTVIGAIPIVGDVFDAAWKSNLRNVEILRRYIAEQAQPAATDPRKSQRPFANRARSRGPAPTPTSFAASATPVPLSESTARTSASA